MPTRRDHAADHRDRPRSGSDKDLLADLHRMDGASYGVYRRITGAWDYGDFILHVDRVQSDPFAPPSSVHVIASPQRMGLPSEALASSDARVATADYLARVFSDAITRLRRRNPEGQDAAGTALSIPRAGQEILQRSSVNVTPHRVELRFHVQLPARGRTIQGHRAARIFDEDIPDAIMDTFDFVSEHERVHQHRAALMHHIRTLEDHRALQEALTVNGWVAFVADGSVLARRSGVSQLPLPDALPFSSPSSLRAQVTLPHAGTITGMAVATGVSIIVGGGFHGKSTLLSAIQHGVYPHVPGDGRELVATVANAVKVRAADGRAVTGVDVSPFMSELPGGIDTSRFSTVNASGSTSQAAALMEAVEVGSSLLLIDEDTSATNLLIRDERMRALVSGASEPITPLVDRIRSLADEGGVSTIMVMGGSGDYLDVADRILMLDTYRCLDVSEQAREVVAALPRELGHAQPLSALSAASPWHRHPRVPVRSRRTSDRPRTKSQGLESITLDKQVITVADIEQIVDPGQCEAIAWMLRGILEELADGRASLPELLARLERRIQSEGLDTVTKFGARPRPSGLVRPRLVDVAAVFNRFRGLSLVE